MIPKVIHYCWFGGNPLPAISKKCIRSWKKFCPGYEIIEWNEKNYSMEKAPLYVQQAYQAQKWAFVTDYVRLQIIYEQGGIYLDTDVELIKSLESFRQYKAYFGFENGKSINTGLGFGAEKGCSIIKEMMDDYQHIPFVKEDGTFDTMTCPKRNTEIFLKNNLRQDDSKQILADAILIFPTEYFSPKDWQTGELNVTENTHSIHHCSASWYTPEMKKKLKKIRSEEWMRHLPSNIGTRLLGKETYFKLREKLKKQ